MSPYRRWVAKGLNRPRHAQFEQRERMIGAAALGGITGYAGARAAYEEGVRMAPFAIGGAALGGFLGNRITAALQRRHPNMKRGNK